MQQGIAILRIQTHCELLHGSAFRTTGVRLSMLVEIGNTLSRTKTIVVIITETSLRSKIIAGSDGRLEKSQTYRLTDAAKVVGNISTIVELPTHESQVRPLTKLEPEQQRQASQIVTEAHSHSTATALFLQLAVEKPHF